LKFFSAIGPRLILVLLLQVEKYAFNVVENGKNINEQVEIDEEENTEVIRVPKHDDVNEVNLLNDCTGVISKSIQC